MIVGKIMRNSDINNLRNISKEYKFKVLDLILLTVFMLLIAGAASFLENRSLVVFIFILITTIFIIKRKPVKKKVIYLWIIWTLINLMSLLISSSDYFSLATFIGVTLRLIIPFFIISILGHGFYDKLNRYIFVLVCISSLFYLIDQIFPGLFNSLAPHLNFITTPEQKQRGGFYIFTYMHSAWGSGRNAGFMWEPGGYAAILIFILSYRLSANGFKVDKYVTVYLIAILTTFSTAGYLALFLIIVAFIINVKRYRYLMIISILPLFLWASLNIFKSNEFMEEKIHRYLKQGTDIYEWEFGGQSKLILTRLGIALVTLEESAQWPFGFGISKSAYTLNKYGDVVGPNSLADILHKWGWFGLFYFYYITYRFYRRNCGKAESLLFTISFFIVLFSNPFFLSYLIYSLPYYVFIYNKNKT